MTKTNIFYLIDDLMCLTKYNMAKFDVYNRLNMNELYNSYYTIDARRGVLKSEAESGF